MTNSRQGKMVKIDGKPTRVISPKSGTKKERSEARKGKK